MPAVAAIGQRLRARFHVLSEESSFLRHYIWKYRKLVGLGLLSLVVVDILEVIPPILLKETVDIALERKPFRYLMYFALAYLGSSLIQAAGRYGWRMFLIRSSILSGRDLRGRYVRHLFSLSSSFFDKQRVGDLMSLATNDVDAVRMAIGHGLLTFADSLFYFLTVPVAMYLLSPKLMLLALLPLPIVPLLVIRNEREINKRFEKVQESFSRISAMAQENLNGIRVVKAFAAEDTQLSEFQKEGEKFIRINMSFARVQSAFGPTLDFTMSLGLVMLLFIGGPSVITGAVTIGTFVAFQRYIQKMIWPMAALGLSISYYQRAVASSGRLKQIFAEQTDVPDASKVSQRISLEDISPRPLSNVSSGAFWRTPGRVEFRNLSFRFPGAEQEVLKNISLTIEPGERVAFVGTIGAGKSALLSLLPRLYPVGRGMLLLDGVDVNDWPLEELRRQVGFVSQDVFLFSETITENVAFGLHEWVESRTLPASVEESMRLAAVHEDVLGLADSYGTRLGERGVNLSGGQKQRITIARAIAKRPSILVLDDALSSVDISTEEKILRGLRSRPQRNTEIIAAHRISTVKDADRIVILEAGMIRQVGDHTALMKDRRGAYRRFYEQQRMREDFELYVEKYTEKTELGTS